MKEERVPDSVETKLYQDESRFYLTLSHFWLRLEYSNTFRLLLPKLLGKPTTNVTLVSETSHHFLLRLSHPRVSSFDSNPPITSPFFFFRKITLRFNPTTLTTTSQTGSCTYTTHWQYSYFPSTHYFWGFISWKNWRRYRNSHHFKCSSLW